MAHSRTRWGEIGLIATGIVLALIGGAIVATVVILANSRERPATHETTLCLTEEAPPAHTIILVDQSSRFTRSQTQRVRNVIDEERRRLPRHGLITILYLNPDEPYESEQLLALCNPGSGEDVNIFYEDPAYVQRIWEEGFGRRIDTAIDGLLVPQSTETSPILEAIRGLQFRPDFDDDEARRLVIVSDMIQNSPLLSQYAEAWSGDAAIANMQTRQLMPDLRNVTIRVELLQSPETLPLQTDRFREFWRRYFEEAGAPEVESF